MRQPSVIAGTEELVLEIPPDPEQVRTARLFGAAAARHFEIDEERVEDLKVAISEACTNAIKSHQDAGVSDAVTIVAAPIPDGLRVTVVDRGRGFDPDLVAKGGEDYTPAGGLAEGTLGLQMIRALFPSLRIERNADRGMTVSIDVPASGADPD